MLTILYVDDETALLEIGKIYLERGGRFSVDGISSAHAALELMTTKNYDAVISDYLMPEMDGIEFLKRVRSTGNTIPFILFTGRGREEIVIQALNEGADYYLQKGGDPKAQFAELEHKIRQAVQHRQDEESIRYHERREQEIINFLPDATFAIDTDGVVIEWNRAIEAMTGVAAAEMVGKGSHEYALPFYRERRPLLIDLVLLEDTAIAARYPGFRRDGRIISAEARIPHMRDGKGAWLWFAASPLFNDRNEVIGAIETIRDMSGMRETQDRLRNQGEELQAAFEEITATEEELRQNLDELTRSHEALQASEARYRTIVDTANEGIWALDRDLRTTFVNQRMADLLGYTRDGMLGRTVESFMVPEDLPDHREKVEERRAGKPGRYERRFLRSDGTVIWAEVSSVPLLTRDGTFDGTFAMFTDITARKEADDALRQKNNELLASFEQITAAEEELRQSYDELRQYEQSLRESTEYYRAVFENTGTAMVIIEADTIIHQANGEFASLSGYPREEIEGRKRWTEFVVREDLDRMLAQHRRRREDPAGALSHYEFRFITRTGEIRTILLTIGMVPGTSRSIASLMDITQRKQAEDESARIAQEWERTFNASDDAIWILDADQRILRSNSTAERMFGSPKTSFTGRHCWEIVHGTTTPVEGCPCVTARASMHRETMELQRGEQWFEVTVDPLRNETGGFAGAVHIIRDISARRQAETALRQGEAEFREFFNSTGDAIVIHDLEGNFLAVNDEICRRLGYSRDELLKMTPADIDAPEFIGLVPERIMTLRRTGHVLFETAHRTKDGNLIPTEVSSRVITYHGQPAILSAGRDITERRRAEDALRKAHRQLGMMTSITRHDINNQILGIHSYLGLARTRSADPAMEEFIQRLESATETIRSQIEFTKIYQELGSQKPRWLEPGQLLQTLHVPEPITLVTDIRGVEVFADAMLGKVFSNLIDNAVRHGEHVTRIRVSSQQSGNQLVIVVEDDGVGIPADEKEKIFHRGFGKNTGLGLFLVREILSLTGMSIRETGEPGLGARFEILVPFGMFRIARKS